MEIEEDDIVNMTTEEMYGLPKAYMEKPKYNEYDKPCVNCGNLIISHNYNYKTCERCQ